MAALEEAGLAAEAIPGGNGQFDVVANGGLVFSKHDLGRFPEDGEILELLRED